MPVLSVQKDFLFLLNFRERYLKNNQFRVKKFRVKGLYDVSGSTPWDSLHMLPMDQEKHLLITLLRRTKPVLDLPNKIGRLDHPFKLFSVLK